MVLLEDFGALIGLALVGVGLAEVTGNARFDAMGSVAIALILVMEMKSLLIREAASPAVVARLRGAIETSDRVLGVIHLATQHFGPEELLVGAKVAFDIDVSLIELAQAIDAVEERIRAGVPKARVIYIEPDVRRPVEAPEPA